MRVLLTGANGFVGSHILDVLLARGLPVSILIRKASDTRFIEHSLADVEVHYGSLSDERSLRDAMRSADCVIHCAGKTKAVRIQEFYEVNHEGTRNVVLAANGLKGTLKHLVHISSRAVSGPANADAPAHEDDPPRPVSDYGKSKLLAEQDLRGHCEVPYTILRPSAVYGPRDTDFLLAFQAVRLRLMPLFGGGRLDINMVYALDVAEAVVGCLNRPEAFCRVYNVASPESCTAEAMMNEIARQMRVRAIPLRFPVAGLYPVCVVQGLVARLRGKPGILGRDKLLELKQPGWVCSTERIRRELGFVAATSLRDGIALTFDWYRRNGWL